MDPFEIDQDDRYEQLSRDCGRAKRERRIKIHKRKIVEKAINRPKK